MTRRRVTTSGEQAVHTGWRRVLCWTRRAGATARVKRRTNRRERREGAAEARRSLRED